MVHLSREAAQSAEAQLQADSPFSMRLAMKLTLPLPLAAVAFVGPVIALPQATFEVMSARMGFVSDSSADGSIAIGSSLIGHPNPFWRGIVVDEFGTPSAVVPPTGFPSCLLGGVSDDGSKICGKAINASGTRCHAVIWDGLASPRLLDSPTPFVSDCGANAMSSDGRIVAGHLNFDACRWDEFGVPTFLGTLPGNTASDAYGMSADGSVVVGLSFGGSIFQRAFRWTAATGMVSIGPPPGYSHTIVVGVSREGGTVVGNAYPISPTGVSPWRWTEAGGLVFLPDPPPGIPGLRVTAMSGDAQVIAGHVRYSSTDEQAYVWTEDQGYERLDSYLGRYGLAANTQVADLESIGAMSSDGRTLLGVNTGSGGFFSWRANDGSRCEIQNSTCAHGTPNQTGSPASLFIDGSPFAAANDVSLRAEGLPPGQFNMFVASLTSSAPMIPSGSIAPLCLGGAIGRYARAGEIKPADRGGAAQLRLDLPNTPNPLGVVSVIAGQTWHYQAWHRDVFQGQASANFTDAVNVTYR